jgi:hypothetical protein
MKNYILSLIALFAVTGMSHATTVSQTVAAGQSTNLVQGACKVTQLVTTATTATNALLQFVDAPTATNFTYVLPAYTNTLVYATNNIFTITNTWFGSTTLVTNLQLVTATQTVASTTNTYPARVSLAALASSGASLQSVNYYFVNGVQLTNAGVGTAIGTVTYTK